jgi:hypothetical protein
MEQRAQRIVDVTDRLFTDLERLADATAPLLAGATDAEALAAVAEPLVAEHLAEHELSIGAGMATAPEAGGLGPLGTMVWWRRDDGAVRRKQHVDNPESDSYYDFAHSRWFRTAVETRQRTLIAPFVDSWGTDDLTMVAAVPVVVGDAVLGVVAADLVVRTWLAAVDELLDPMCRELLLDAEDRVVASSDPTVELSVRLRALGEARVERRVPVGASGWTLVHLA